MSGTFGTGGAEPYGGMLAGEPTGPLLLRRIDGSGAGIRMDAERWLGELSAADHSALSDAAAPLLDVGCGPGRMVRAAAERSVSALGIDVSQEAVDMTRSDGSPALLLSVFDRLPLEGRWATILLMDGNVGIGGDPFALLCRCAELLAPDGSIVIEADAEAELYETAVFTAADGSGNVSGPFPWARVGHRALDLLVHRAGLVVDSRWESEGRYFVRARRSRSLGASSAAAITTSTAIHTPVKESA